MAIFVCRECGEEKEGRCKPRNAPVAVRPIPLTRKSNNTGPFRFGRVFLKAGVYMDIRNVLVTGRLREELQVLRQRFPGIDFAFQDEGNRRRAFTTVTSGLSCPRCQDAGTEIGALPGGGGGRAAGQQSFRARRHHYPHGGGYAPAHRPLLPDGRPHGELADAGNPGRQPAAGMAAAAIEQLPRPGPDFRHRCHWQ